MLPDGAVQVVSTGQGITSEQCNELTTFIADGLRSGQSAARAAEVLVTAARDVAGRNEAVGRGLLISVLPRKAVPVQVRLQLGAPVFSDDQATFVHLPADSGDPVLRGPDVACGGMVHVEPMVSSEPLPPPRPIPRI
jgi:hypothetical protein